MHEYSLARSLLRQVDKLRREQRALRVLTVRIRIGEFSGIEPELLQTAFGELTLQTPASGAQLQMERVPLMVRCDNCGSDNLVTRYRFACPHCESRSVQIIGGEELLLESITMEFAEP